MSQDGSARGGRGVRPKGKFVANVQKKMLPAQPSDDSPQISPSVKQKAEAVKRIQEIRQQIGLNPTKSITVLSGLDELKKDIQPLIEKLREHDGKTPQDKRKKNDGTNEASNTVKLVVAEKEIASENSELQSFKRELSNHLNRLDEVINTINNALGMPDYVKETLPTTLNDQRKRTNQNKKRDVEENTIAQAGVKTEERSRIELSISAVQKALTAVNELQEYKSKIDADLITYKKLLDTKTEMEYQIKDMQKNLLQFILQTKDLGENGSKSNESDSMEELKDKEKHVENKKTVNTTNKKSTQMFKEEETPLRTDWMEEFQGSIEQLKQAYIKIKNKLQKNKRLLKRIFDKTEAVLQNADQRRGQLEHQVPNLENAERDEMLRFDQILTEIMQELKEDKNQILKLQRELKSATELNSEWQIRLSKLAGSKLTDNNPNITNLGDPNRPMKIGECFSELYDNEWTDAIDLCTNKKTGSKGNEDKIIENLYKTLMSCYKICEEKSESMVKNATGKFEDVLGELKVEAQEEVFKQVIDRWKLSAEEISDQLLMEVRSQKDVIAKKHLTKVDDKYLKVLLPSHFFTNCFKLCWKMVVQTPKMILQEGPPVGHEFDRNVFREYTSSGSKVVSTVWPALYLHKGGPLLSKGVVKVK